MSNRTLFAFSLLLVVALPGAASAGGPSGTPFEGEQQLEGSVENPWIRLSALPGRPAAGYMTIVNSSPFDGFLVGAGSDALERVEIHRSVEDGGIVRMQKVESVLIPRRGALQLAPGGYHLMVIGVGENVSPGDRIMIRLHLKGQADKPMIVTVPFTFRAIGETPPG